MWCLVVIEYFVSYICEYFSGDEVVIMRFAWAYFFLKALRNLSSFWSGSLAVPAMF